MNSIPTIAHVGAVAALVWGLITVTAWSLIVHKMWRWRWNQRFIDADATWDDDVYARNAYTAFLKEAHEQLTERLDLTALLLYPIGIAIAVSVVWWALSVYAVVVVG